MAIPCVDCGLLLRHGPLEIAQDAQVVHWANIAGDGEREGSHLRAHLSVAGKQSRFGPHLLQVFDDGERLRQHPAFVLERGQ
jgi:hypothetical protein